ncbi:MAG TPA: ATP-binding protein [Kofleriaceae bacterium]|jgi:predicted nucleic acid-binding protein
MSTASCYARPSEILADRVAWALATLATHINAARLAGWLDGAPLSLATSPDVLRAEIRNRLESSSTASVSLDWLGVRLGLTEAEADLLWLLAVIEIDPRAAKLSDAFGSSACAGLNVQVVQQMMKIGSAQLASLDHWGLIEMTSDPRLPLHRRSLRANDRVLDIARGDLQLDSEIGSVASLVRCNGTATAGAVLADVEIAVGPEGSGRATMLAERAGRLGLGTLRVNMKRLGDTALVRERRLRAIAREACMFDAVPMLQDASPDDVELATRCLAKFPAPILITSAEPVVWPGRTMQAHTMTMPTREQSETIWASALGDANNTALEAAGAFRLWPGTIKAAARSAIINSAQSNRVDDVAVHQAVRVQLGEQLASVAKKVEVTQTWDDLVLPPDQFEQVIELVARVRQRRTVLESWGFGAKIGRGHGVAALFSGPPGTGKTMVAGLIATELGLDLYQVDVSKLVSKYIGETEKQLAALFDAAESGHAILLFDEADSLFAKRSAVTSSNDRYANLETNYLLQRLESFTGVCILTTNHETAIDEAFRRRLAVQVRFDVPDCNQRRDLWRAVLPAQAPYAGTIDLDALAERFAMTGGYIKNAALRAAYLAAERGESISTNDLLRGAKVEYEAMGKVACD